MPNKKKSTNSRRATNNYNSRSRAATEASQLNAQKQAIGKDLAALLVDTLQTGQNPFADFPGLTQKLKQKQDELDLMAADSLPAAILTDYVSDVLLPNSNGDLISLISDVPEHQQIINDIYKRLSLPLEKVVYSLCKNGIVIGEFQQFSQKSVASQVAANEQVEEKKPLSLPEMNAVLSSISAEEQVLVRKPGTILPNISILTDTYTVFPILKYEKCIGYLEVRKDIEFFRDFNWETDSINYTDVVVHPAVDYAYETFGVPHSSKPLQLTVKGENDEVVVYDIAVGCSMLEDAYTAWKTLSLLQDSIVLASLIKNAQIMLVEVEGGTATKQQIEAAKMKLRSLFEGQLTMGRQGMKSYLNPQSKPAYVYSFTSNGVGKITANLVGGEYNPGQLYYLTPFVNQFFAAMRAPKQNYGFTEGAGGLDGGGAVEEYNKRYKSTVARVKRIVGSFIKRCVNNVLISRGLSNIVDNFTVKVYGAYDETTNQEIQELQTKLSLYEQVISFTGIEDPDQLRQLRSLMLKQVITDPKIVEIIDQTMTPKEAESAEGGEGEQSANLDDLALDDSQLSPDVSDELGVETPQSEPPQEGQGEELELPEMSDTLTAEDTQA